MNLTNIKNKIPQPQYNILKKTIKTLRPSQQKSIQKGLLKHKNLLVCTPTASGKTLIAELASIKNILEKQGKAIYITPLKALANEKYKDFKTKYQNLIKIGIATRDKNQNDTQLHNKDMIFCTSEKLDSLLRHKTPWINTINTLIIDEIHLLNDPTRGPTLEILITLLKITLPKIQIIGLSATIGNPQELAEWLNAQLITDTWRPVNLSQGIYLNGHTTYHKKPPT